MDRFVELGSGRESALNYQVFVELLHFRGSAALRDAEKEQTRPAGLKLTYLSFTTVLWLSLMLIFSS